MQRVDAGHSGEFYANNIEPAAILSLFLNLHRHEDCVTWCAEHKLMVNLEQHEDGYWKEQWRQATVLTGNGKQLSEDEALAIIHEYERATNPDTPSVDKFGWFYLTYDRRYQIWQQHGIPY